MNLTGLYRLVRDAVESRFTVEEKVEDEDGSVTDPDDGQTPDFYGVYERLDDGKFRNLADFESCDDAEKCRDAITDVLTNWLKKKDDAPEAILMNSAELYRLALEAINKLFADTSVDPEKTRDSLENLREELDALINAIAAE